VTVTDPATGAATWETLKDSTGTNLEVQDRRRWKHTYRYTPVRNYWYRATTETSEMRRRVTVRQTIVIRPIHLDAAGRSRHVRRVHRHCAPVCPVSPRRTSD
jgi:hypothetical protein